MHGAEFYANKKHKGGSNMDNNSEDGGNGNPIDSSPRSEDMSGKTASLSSPSIKSESDANSPGVQNHGSPMGLTHLTGAEDYDANGALPSMGSVSAMDDPNWPYEDEDLEV